MRLLVLLGPPGVGKGTASKRIVAELGFQYLSTGDMLRAAKQSGSEFGKRIAEYVDAGRLVPDDLIITLVIGEMERLSRGTRLLIDGFPRTLPQAVALDENLESNGNQIGLVVELQADRAELERRIVGRSQTDGRADDTTATLQHRLDVFHLQTAPLTDYYRQQGKLQVVHAMGTPADVFDRIHRCIRTSFEPDANPSPETR